MKKLIVIIIMLFIAITPGFAQDIDLSTFSLEELTNLHEQIDEELRNRREIDFIKLEIGEYIGGTDIPEGKYYTYLGQIDPVHDTTKIEIYDNDKKLDSNFIWGLVLPSKSYIINSNNIVKITEGPIILSKTLLSYDDLFPYNIPEGTLIPIGTYDVGIEIPSGKYFVYASENFETSKITVYSNEITYSDNEPSVVREINSYTNNNGSSIKLTDENVLHITGSPIIMRKASFDFDFD